MRNQQDEHKHRARNVPQIVAIFEDDCLQHLLKHLHILQEFEFDQQTHIRLV